MVELLVKSLGHSERSSNLFNNTNDYLSNYSQCFLLIKRNWVKTYLIKPNYRSMKLKKVLHSSNIYDPAQQISNSPAQPCSPLLSQTIVTSTPTTCWLLTLHNPTLLSNKLKKIMCVRA